MTARQRERGAAARPAWWFAPVALLVAGALVAAGPEGRSERVVRAGVGSRSAGGAALAADPGAMSRRAAGARLETAGRRIDWDARWGTPTFVRDLSGPLAPAAAGRDGAAVVRAYLDLHADLFGVDGSILDRCEVVRDATTERMGVRTLWFRQLVNGRPLLGAELRANVGPDGALLTIGGTLLPEPEPGALAPRATLGREGAIVAAARAIGVGAGRAADVGRTMGLLQAEPEAREAYFAVRVGEIVPVWEVTLGPAGSHEVFDVVVHGATGDALAIESRVHCAAEPATFHVFTGDSPTPMLPGFGAPGGLQPAEAGRSVVSLAAMDPVASPDGWIDPGESRTIGNNAAAGADLDNNNVLDLPLPDGGAERVFEFPLDLGGAPIDSLNAAIVQAFFAANWAHDFFHGLGFTEPFGAYQERNFGRGGIEGDRVFMDVQGSSDNRNAYFISSGADGSPGRVKLYLYPGASPARDSALDNQILLHELAHGLSLRLHKGLRGQQSAGMGEGWSDFFALAMLTDASADPEGAYPFGAYVAHGFGTGGPFDDNYYYGVRRYPYSTDHGKNPVTFADIDPAQFDVDPAAPRSPLLSGVSPSRVHQIGEVWCSALWECRARLIAAHGPAGADIMFRLVVDAMKLTTTSSPNLVSGRDAILLADVVANGGENVCDLWEAFACRGLGFGAFSADAGVESIVESFESNASPRLYPLSPGPTALEPGVATVLRIAASHGCAGTVFPDTLTLWVAVDGGPFAPFEASMGGGLTASAALPALECGREVEYFFSVLTTEGEVYLPAGGAGTPHRAVVEPGLSLATLQAPDRRPTDFFGFGCAVGDGLAVAGAPQRDGAQFNSGAVYVFERSAAGAWTLGQILAPGDSRASDLYGFACAVDDGTIVAGAWRAASARAERSGVVYVHSREPGGLWLERQRLAALDAATDDGFGFAVDIDGPHIVVGAPREDTRGTDAGAAYLFRLGTDGVWRQESRITAEEGRAGDLFGASVAVSGTRAVAGAGLHATARGAAYVFERVGVNDWRQAALLEPADPGEGDEFGDAVDIDGDVALVGAPKDNARGADSGSVYVFRRDPCGVWRQEAKLLASDGRSFDEFGGSVALEGDLALVGSARADVASEGSGAAYVFRRGSDGVWREQRRFVPPSSVPNQQFGISVALEAGVALVGAWLSGDDGSQWGSAHLFDVEPRDCDGDGVADACAIAAGDAADADLDMLPNECETRVADLNNDGVVNTADLGLLIQQFGSGGPFGDLNGDRAVDAADLAMVFFGFGR